MENNWQSSSPKKSMTSTGSSLNDDFWKQTLCLKRSTFGGTIKSPPSSKDEYDSVAKQTKKWAGCDKDGHTHGRLTITTRLGKIVNVPGSTDYSTEVGFEKTTKFENAPQTKVLPKPFDPYVERAKREKKHINSSDLPRDWNGPQKVKKRPKPEKKTAHENPFGMSTQDMDKALLPGPGQYKPLFEKTEKFEKPPEFSMAPRQQIAQVRSRVDFHTLDIITGYDRRPNDGDYDLSKDPRKTNIAHSLAPKTRLHGLREQLGVGPGQYDITRADPYGKPSQLSNGKTYRGSKYGF